MTQIVKTDRCKLTAFRRLEMVLGIFSHGLPQLDQAKHEAHLQTGLISEMPHNSNIKMPYFS